MPRREFLKKLGVVGGATVIAPKTVAQSLVKPESIFNKEKDTAGVFLKLKNSIAEVLFANTTYQKDCSALLNPSNDFDVFKRHDGAVVMQNYEFPMYKEVTKYVDKGILPQVKGVCNELGAYVAKTLAVKFPDHDVYLLRGQEPLYFFNKGAEHVFPAIRKDANYNLSLIDPSFKTTDDKGYKIIRPILKPDNLRQRNLGDILDSVNRDTIIKPGSICSYPLGFINDLSTTRESKAVLSQIPLSISDKTLAHFTVKNIDSKGKAELGFELQNPKDAYRHFDDFESWMLKLERENPARKFLERIQSDKIFTTNKDSFVKFK